MSCKRVSIFILLLTVCLMQSETCYSQVKTHRLFSRNEYEVKKTEIFPSKVFTLQFIHSTTKLPLEYIHVIVTELNIDLYSDSLGTVSFELPKNIDPQQKIKVEILHRKYHAKTMYFGLQESKTKTIRLIRNRHVIDGCPSF